MNDASNIAYAARAKNGGALTLPVLFLHAACDDTCDTMDSRLAEPMRRDCTELTEAVVPLGPLDGPGAAHPGQLGAGEMARRQSGRRLAGVKRGVRVMFQTGSRAPPSSLAE